MDGVSGDSERARPIGERQSPAERRDVTARVVRESLADRLGVHPREMGTLSHQTASHALANLNVALGRIQQLQAEAAIDELTGVLRRGHGMLTLAREVGRSFRSPDERLVVAFVDVDGLKALNDRAGHAEGDRLLVDLTTSISRRLRSHDVVFRYGGDEFVCILPGADLAGATRILQSIARSFAHRGRGRRFSFGLAELAENDTPEGLLARADAALYESRSQSGPAGRRAELAPA